MRKSRLNGASTMAEPTNKPKIDPAPEQQEAVSIAKPGAFDLERFKSKRAPTAAGVQSLLTALPHHSIAQAVDFVRLHSDELAYWSGELCFAKVPIKGQRENLHLIEEDLAMQFYRLRSFSVFAWRWRQSRTTSSSCAMCQLGIPTIHGCRATCRHASKRRRSGRSPPAEGTRMSKATR